MTPYAPIGVLDSGLGGLSVLCAIRGLVPSADVIYCADHAFLPYGDRPETEVRVRTLLLGDALEAAGARAIVLACNTATAAAAEALRARSRVPVIGMEPAVKPATAATRSGVVGVLGTGGTLGSTRFAALLDRFAADVRVVTRPAPELVTAVEAGTGDSDVAAAVKPLVDAGADVIVLGCTHFPFLHDAIAAAAGSGVELIDTGPAVARELLRRLGSDMDRGAGRTVFWTTGDPAAVAPAVRRLWGPTGEIERAPLPAHAAD